MQAIKKILVTLDPNQDAQPALQKGIYLAQKFDASLELLLAVYNRSIIANSFFSSKQLEQAKTAYLESQSRWLDSYVEEVKAAQVEVNYSVVWHKPLYEAIIQQVKLVDADMAIKSTHHHPTINKVFFTPNDWQLLKSCPVPLILAKDKTASEYNKILAGIDPNKSHGKPASLDPKIVTAANSIADATGADCHITHCYSPIEYQLWSDIGMGMGVGMGPTDFSMGENSYQDYVDELKQNLRSQFDEVLEPFHMQDDKLHLEEGYPEQVLPKLVDEKDIDLLVLGAIYHSGLVGSTTEKILDQVNCDVLSINAATLE